LVRTARGDSRSAHANPTAPAWPALIGAADGDRHGQLALMALGREGQLRQETREPFAANVTKTIFIT
jgi:hypothetical protein